jgi:hypothetical protein
LFSGVFLLPEMERKRRKREQQVEGGRKKQIEMKH